MWLSVQMLCLIIRPFVSRVLDFPILCCGTWSGSVHRVHNALQELEVVSLMLCKVVFQLLGMTDALVFDSSTAKAHLCNEGGTASVFLSRLTCCILSLADKHGIYIIPTYISTHLNVEANYV